MVKLVVHEIDGSSVTLAWSVGKDAVKYEVQLMESDAADASWTTISDSLKGNMIRKKNLAMATSYAARVRARDAIDWGEYSVPVEFKILQEDTTRMMPPTLQSRDSQSITVRWTEVDGASSYHVQYRNNNGLDGHPEDWQTLSVAVKGFAIRKKNLHSDGAYFFRVVPNFEGQAGCWAFSSPSESFSVAHIALYTSDLLGPRLIDTTGQELGVYTLAGQTVGVYASASWCGPCRQFTPQLASFYNQAKAAGRAFEVVFVSCDRDEQSFKQYFSTMPWLAVPYNSKEREAALSQMQVQGIPRLMIVSGDGRIVDNNAVQTPLTLAQIDLWAANKTSGQGAAGGGNSGCSGATCCGRSCSR